MRWQLTWAALLIAVVLAISLNADWIGQAIGIGATNTIILLLVVAYYGIRSMRWARIRADTKRTREESALPKCRKCGSPLQGGLCDVCGASAASSGASVPD